MRGVSSPLQNFPRNPPNLPISEPQPGHCLPDVSLRVLLKKVFHFLNTLVGGWRKPSRNQRAHGGSLDEVVNNPLELDLLRDFPWVLGVKLGPKASLTAAVDLSSTDLRMMKVDYSAEKGESLLKLNFWHGGGAILAKIQLSETKKYLAPETH